MIFLLGGNGFVGSAFARACEATGREYEVITRSNYAAFVGKACKVFINANGNSRKYLAQRDPVGEFDASVRSVRSTLTDFKFDQYVHLSSCDVYPDCSSPENNSEDQPVIVAHQSPYGFHKHLAEQCVRHAAKTWLIVRFGGFVGPGLKKNPIFDILHGGPLWLDPESELQYLHTDRAAAMILTLIDRSLWRNVVNICGRGVVRLQDIIKLGGKDIPVQPGSPRVRYEINITKLLGIMEVPDTRDTVFEFARAELRRLETRSL